MSTQPEILKTTTPSKTQEMVESSDPAILLAFLEYLGTIKGVSPGTLRSYQYDLRLFMRFLLIHRGVVSISDNTPESFHAIDISCVNVQILANVSLSEFHEFLSYVGKDRANSAKTRSRKVTCIRSFFTYLVDKADLLQNNPASELESPKFRKLQPKYLNLSESRQLIMSINGRWYERDYAILTLFLNCGIRLSELIGMNIEDMRDSRITILGKGRKERTVYLNEACRNAINNYLMVRPANIDVSSRNALFLSERKKRMAKGTVQFLVKKYIGLSGLDTQKYSTHKLRHTAATLMYQHGAVDIRALQDILGHGKLSTTVIYTHLNEKQLREAVESNPLSQVRPPQRN